MKTTTVCMCCGLKNGHHKTGCEDYRKMISAMFGNDARKIFEASDNGLLPPPPWKKSAKSTRGPHKVQLTPQEINKINLLWFLNGWNLTNICKSLQRSLPVIERNLFATRNEWYKWSDKMTKEGKL